MSARGKILVIRGGAIGDFILTTPVLRALREQFPQAGLEVMGYARIAELAVESGLADRVQSIEARELAAFFAPGARPSPEMSAYFAQFAIIISFLYDPDQIFETNVRSCSKAQFIAGPHRPDESLNIHATEVYLKPLERLAIYAPDPVPRFDFPAEQDDEPGSSQSLVDEGAWLAVHVGSGSPRKNWAEERWAELLHGLSGTTAWNFLLIGGEAEEGRAQRVAEAIHEHRRKLAVDLPLPQLARELRRAKGFVGHDSGISHLAAAVGLPGLVLWGHTRKEIWRPLGPLFTVLEGPLGLDGLTVAEVQRPVLDLMGRHGAPEA